MRVYLLTLMLFLSPLLSYGDDDTFTQKDAINFTEQYTRAFDKRDPHALASYWTEDANYSNPVTGVSVKGRSAIEEEFKKWFAEGKIDKVETKILSVETPDEETAVVKGVLHFTFKDGAPPYENAYRAVLVKTDNKWLIDEINQIELATPKSNYDHLKDLEWLIGNWIDSDENSSIELTAKWNDNKNYILQSYNIKIFDMPTLTGKQIIGWDPIKKQIRSWYFDSDGGFGEGFWYKKDKSWFVDSVYILSDGRKATATHIYTPVDQNTYTWASENRDVDGIILPNIAPIKVVKVNSKESE